MECGVDRIFQQALGTRISGGTALLATLPIDAYLTDNEIVISADLPGIDPDDVSITVDGDTLTIEGEILARLANVKYQFAERFHGKFHRAIHLNVPIAEDSIEATFENGVLTLVLPKAEEVKPKRIAVTSSS